jgi:glucosamine-phosphate N-acetyltransferase
MEDEFIIREAKIDDLNDVLNLVHQLSPLKEDQVVDKDKLRGIFEDIIHDSNYLFYVFEIEGRIVGCGSLLVQLNLSHGGKSYGHIENVVVDKNCRGKGVGKKLIEYLIEKAKFKNCYKVILNCEEHNAGFYGKCGLRETGEVEFRIDF